MKNFDIYFEEEPKTTFEVNLNVCLDFLCKEFKVKNKPKLIIKNDICFRVSGAYYPQTNEILISKNTRLFYNNRIYSYEYILLHEFYHMIQIIQKTLIVEGNFLFFENQKINMQSFYIMEIEEYRNLPWEKEADNFAEEWEPVLIKKFGLIEKPIKNFYFEPIYKKWFNPVGFEKGVLKDYKVIKAEDLKIKPKNKSSNENAFWAIEKQKYNHKVSKF